MKARIGSAAAATLFGVFGGIVSWFVLGADGQGASSVPVREQRANHVEAAVVTARTADVSSVLTMEGLVTGESGQHVARASVAPAHLYRFVDPPDTARVKIVDGPEPFKCSGVKIGAESADPAGDVFLTCLIPDSVKVFSGLPLKVAVETGRARNAVTVPVSALSGSTGSAHVTVVDASGKRERRRVEVGVVNGVLAQVTRGLKAGEKVQDPVADAFTEDSEYTGTVESGTAESGTGSESTG